MDPTPGNGKPAGFPANEGGRVDVKGNRTAGEINRDPLRDLGSKLNGSKEDGRESGLELQGMAVGETSEKRKQGGEEGQVPGTECKQGGKDRLSKEKVRDSRD